MLNEDQIVQAVCAFLPSVGWKVKGYCSTSQKGVDIEAANAKGEELRVEAKGATSAKPSSERFGKPFSATQIRSHVSRAFFKAASDFGNGYRIGMALPDTIIHRRLLDDISKAILRLEIIVFLVSDDSSVAVWNTK
jgi:hypothetical protein